MTKKMLSIAVALCMLLVAMTVMSGPARASTPTVWTDKADYAPSQTPIISGSGFAASADITVTVLRPDGVLDSLYSMSDDAGNFACSYQLDGIMGTYLVTATDGVNTATTTFTDALQVDWLQGEDDHDGDGSIETPMVFWVSGALDGQHNLLTEGNIPPTYPPRIPGHVNYRAIFEGMDAGSYTWIIKYEFQKGGIVAIDFLTTNYGITDANLKTELPSGVSAGDIDAILPSLNEWKFPYDTAGVPGDLDGGTVQDRQVAHETALAAYDPLKMKMYGATITNIVQVSHTISSLADSKDTDAFVQVMFTKTTGETDIVMATWGGHMAIGQPYQVGYGTGHGAGSVSGSPFHMILWNVLDSNGDTLISKSPNLAIQLKAVFVPAIISGHKFNDLNGNGVWDKLSEPALSGWTINMAGTLSGSTTTDVNGYYEFNYLPAGSYTISEVLKPGWVQTAPSGGTYSVTATSGGIYSDRDFGNVLLMPEIDVEKTGPLYAYEGDVITYTITVTNTGNCILYDVAVTDTLLGNIGTIAVLPLDDPLTVPLENVVTFKVQYTVPDPSTADPIPNTVTATGYDVLGGSATDSASWSVDVLHPAIDVAKTADKSCAEAGEAVTYTITVTNPASTDVAIDWFTVSDAALGWSQLWGKSPGQDPTLDLAPGQSVSFTVIVNMPAQTADFVNTADVVGYDIHGKQVTDLTPGSWTVDIVHPDVQITKSADKTCAEAGEVVTYTITVTNPASADIAIDWFTASDALLGWTVTWGKVGGVDPLLDLAPGHSVSFSVPKAMPAQTADFVNTASVTAYDMQGHDETRTSNSWTVDVVHPDIAISKSADKTCAEAGEIVTYTITVTNPASADIAIDWFTASDALLGWSVTWGKVGGVDPLMDLAPGQSVSFTVPKAMPAQTADFVNTASVTAYDMQGHDESATSNSWTVDIVHPDVEITKAADKSCAEAGEPVTYTITVTNPATADISLDWFTVSDSLIGWSETWTGDLAPGQSKAFTVTVNMPDQTDNFVNTASVTAYDMQGHDETRTSNSWTIDIVHPDVQISKSADKTCAEAGEIVTYTITVTNPATADIDIDWFTASDALLGWSVIWGKTGGVEPLLDLAPGQSVSFSVPTAMPSQTEDFVNTASVTAYDMQGHDETRTSNSWTVDIVHPDVEITKTADKSCAEAGEIVTYTITVKNPSTADIAIDWFEASDSLVGWSVVWGKMGGVDPTLDLAPGQSVSFTVPKAMPSQTEDFVNTASVTAYDMQGHDETRTSNTWTVDIVHPDVAISKSADKTCAEAGEVVTYTITVTNPASADIDIDWFTATDALLGWSVTWGKAGGVDPLLDLAPGQSVSFTVPKAMPDQTADFVNTASVTAYDMQGHDETRTSNSWTVDIVHPDIAISKSADKTCAEAGETVTYTITVTNPASADIDIDWFTATDALLGWSVTWGVDPDLDLAPGQSVSFTVPKAMPDQTADFVNTASVTAYDMQGHDESATSNSWTVDIVHPAVEIAKTADLQCAEVGEEVTYTITVTNPASADIAIDWFVVSDAMLQWSETWGVDPDVDLAPGSSVSFTVKANMPDQLGDFVNIASVTAYDMQGHQRGAISSAWTVDIVHPDVSISKSADKSCAEAGEVVTYTITVTNPASADIALDWFTASDTLLGWSVTWGKAGGVDPSMDLAPGQSVSFSVPKAMPAQTADFVNTASVTAYDMQGHDETRTSNSWTVDIVHPDVEITKTADKSCAEAGEVVTYTITVTNPATADIDIDWFTASDALLGWSQIWGKAGGQDPLLNLAPGQSVSFTVPKAMPAQTADFVNTASVTAYDMQGHDETRTSDSWTVDIVHPAVTVTKTADKSCAAEGELVTYTITVTNPASADIDLDYFTVSDTFLGWSQLWGKSPGQDPTLDLAPGHSVSFTVTKNMPVQTEDFVNAAYVDAYDMQGHLRSAVSDAWIVDIVHPDISVSKSGPDFAHDGDTITYTITVTNPAGADIDIDWFTVSDAALGWSQLWGKSPGQDPTLDLAPGQSVSFTVSKTLPAGDYFDNTVSVTGYDMQSHEVTDSASWRVVLLHPGISVTKTGPIYAHELDTITYLIVVENTGDCTLYGVVVIDILLGVNENVGTMDPGDTATITKVYQVPVGSEVVDNTVTTSGHDVIDDAGSLVTAQDVWSVEILHPEIDVIKTGPAYAHLGDVITYTITVENTGDCVLHDVWVIDSLLGNITYLLPDRTLDIGELNTITLTYTVAIEWGDILNTVTAYGIDPLKETVSDTDDHTVHVTMLSVVTNTEYCYFDYDPDEAGQQFRLIFTPSLTLQGTHKMSASNPGQFYYNVFYIGEPGDTVTLTIRIPYPFVTQGAQPVHVYSEVDYWTCGDGFLCYIPMGELPLSEIDVIGAPVVLGGSYNAFGQFAQITVTAEVPESGLVYVTVHVDYGLKQSVNWYKDATDENHPKAKNNGPDGIMGTADDIVIPDLQSYVFSYSSGGDFIEPTVQSENVFKKDPGFAGLVLDADGNPVSNTRLEICGPNGLHLFVYTDADGWYMYSYKYTGKPSTFTIKLMDYRYTGSIVQFVMKSNTMAIVNFNLPYLL